MLLKQAVLDEIAAGRVTLAFRRWRRPTVRPGGTLRTAVGVLAIDAVDVIDAASITEDEAQRAGFSSIEALLDEIDRRAEGDLYRIAFRFAGADPRIELRERDSLDRGTVEELRERLARLDRASRSGPWTEATLRGIEAHPATRAADLAQAAGLETASFKRNVRKLKELGLTKSLGTGYRLSPRGQALLPFLDET
jgi:hypothetical protein